RSRGEKLFDDLHTGGIGHAQIDACGVELSPADLLESRAETGNRANLESARVGAFQQTLEKLNVERIVFDQENAQLAVDVPTPRPGFRASGTAGCGPRM